jgi:hypothetical protein
MRCKLRQDKTPSVLELRALARFLVLGGGCLLWLADTATAQKRPVLLNPKRDYLVGRLVLIPADTRFESFALPRQLAQITDHELLTPPRSLYAANQADTLAAALNDWARSFAFAESEGLLVAVDKLQPITLREIRARHRHLLIYGFSREAAAQSLLNDGTLDYLLIDDTVNAASLLLARWMNQRFGYAPAVAPAFSSNDGRPLAAIVARNAAALRGQVITAQSEMPKADLRLYVHAPQTTAEQRALFVKAIMTNVTAGVRVALMDAADSTAERAELLRLLREAKLADRLTAYATVNLHAPEPAAACQRALAQANLWLIALRFLRDDTERVRRTERAQIASLLNSYLREALFPTLQGDASGTLTERETRAVTALRPQAVTLFNEQFRRNLHSLLLSTGARAEFELRELQRLQVRLDETNSMPEVSTDVYLVLLNPWLAAPGLSRSGWEFNNDNLDERLTRRYDSVSWQTFQTDQPNVALSVKLNRSTAANQQGYVLSSRRAGETRRIQINAASAQGAFYALAHLEQLGANGQLTQDFQFTETPAVAERGFREDAAARWSHHDRLALLRLAGRARLTTVIVTPGFDWRAPLANDEAARVRELLQAARSNFVTLVYALERADEVSASDFAKLTAQLRVLHRLGVEKFLLQSTQPDHQASLTQRARQWLQTHLTGAQLLTPKQWQWLPCATTPLSTWVLPPPPVESTGLLACVNETPRAARLPLAWLGAFAWSGKTLPPSTALATTLNWLYDEKARTGLTPWLAAFAQPVFVNALAGLFDEKAVAVNASLLNETLALLSATLPQFTTTQEQGLLRGELLAWLEHARLRLQQIQNDEQYERMESGIYRRRNP